jgi:endonuclease/exonuclease/phosphatase family metal-dependent hydrolase
VRLRVVTYNVRGFRDGLDRVVRVVSHFQPDVVVLNETGGRLALRRFGRALGMQVARDPWSPFRRRIKDAVLVRAPWRIASSLQRRFATASWLYPRGALVADVHRAGVRIHVIATHLSLHPAERRRHAEELVALVDRLRTPAIVGGDLNERPDARGVAVLGNRLRDAWLLAGGADGETFPAGAPTARIDYLFVTEELRVEGVLVPGGADAREASDHRPVLAVITLPE